MNLYRRIYFPLLIFVAIYALCFQTVSAQSGRIIWDPQINISQSELDTSTDPYLLADPTGIVHIFWAEKTTDQDSNNPDTLIYSQWNNAAWSEPFDVYFAPPEHGNRIVQYPHAVVDNKGIIHVIWLSQPDFPNYSLFYSSVRADQAKFVNSWQIPIELLSDLSGTNYSIDIAVDNQNTLHIVYSRVQSGDTAPELRAVSYIKSDDGGFTWSDPKDIHTIPDPHRGASNNRLIVDEEGTLYTTWSEWDQSGNGQAILFSRSNDSGITWLPAVTLTRRIGSEYERDWNSIAILEEDTLVSFFEGGWRAYRNVMYSYDGGETWTESVDAFPGLIGENGFIEFSRDGSGDLHIFFANRTREGNTLTEGEGLWHSVWLGGEMWSEPVHSSPNINMLNPKAVIAGGNRVVTTWYTGIDREIIVMSGTIVDAPASDPFDWPTATTIPTNTPSPTIDPNSSNADLHLSTPIPEHLAQNPEPYSPTTGLIIGVIASSIALVGFVLIYILLIKKP